MAEEVEGKQELEPNYTKLSPHFTDLPSNMCKSKNFLRLINSLSNRTSICASLCALFEGSRNLETKFQGGGGGAAAAEQSQVSTQERNKPMIFF
ncbi:uncharacterized protein J3R85_020213 [Psidium guajava]|nr:uncharacterized protein J3R85_020213 [Psidium guajava]